MVLFVSECNFPLNVALSIGYSGRLFSDVEHSWSFFLTDQSQKEELDQALKMAADKHNTEKGALENENTKMKEQMSELPGLKEELQTLRARVAELTKITGMMRESGNGT